jgi:hypothetical protein
MSDSDKLPLRNGTSDSSSVDVVIARESHTTDPAFLKIPIKAPTLESLKAVVTSSVVSPPQCNNAEGSMIFFSS